jgi:hypothetical protein
MEAVTFQDWQSETSQVRLNSSSSQAQMQILGASPAVGKCPDSSGKMCSSCNDFYTNEELEEDSTSPLLMRDMSCLATVSNSGPGGNVWTQPESVQYREIVNWPHLNECIQSLEILNIGGTNVLGEFIPFILMHSTNLKSLGQWINTMIYGLEILKQLPGKAGKTFPNMQEFSYSTDRYVSIVTLITLTTEQRERWHRPRYK